MNASSKRKVMLFCSCYLALGFRDWTAVKKKRERTLNAYATPFLVSTFPLSFNSLSFRQEKYAYYSFFGEGCGVMRNAVKVTFRKNVSTDPLTLFYVVIRSTRRLLIYDNFFPLSFFHRHTASIIWSILTVLLVALLLFFYYQDIFFFHAKNNQG